MTFDGPYSQFKLVHHADKVRAIREGHVAPPAQVQIIVSDYCNHDCSFCAYRVSGNASNELFQDGDNHNPKRFIPYEKVLEILDDCREMGVQGIQLTGGGEPSVHPKFGEILQAVLDRGLKLAVVTNGTALKDWHIPLLVKAEWVRVSIDAASPETYAAMRRVSQSFFYRTIANVNRLVSAKQMTKSKTIIGFGFVVTRENWQEITEACDIARTSGVDNFRISAAFLPDNAAYHHPHHQQAAALAKTAEELAMPDFRVFNLYGDRVEDLEQQAPDYEHCVYQFVTTYIGGDLNLYRCCNTAYNRHGLIGSLKEQRFRDAWEGAHPARTSFRAESCDRCQFNRVNRLGNYMLKENAEHASFV